MTHPIADELMFRAYAAQRRTLSAEQCARLFPQDCAEYEARYQHYPLAYPDGLMGYAEAKFAREAKARPTDCSIRVMPGGCKLEYHGPREVARIHPRTKLVDADALAKRLGCRLDGRGEHVVMVRK